MFVGMGRSSMEYDMQPPTACSSANFPARLGEEPGNRSTYLRSTGSSVRGTEYRVVAHMHSYKRDTIQING